MRKLTRIDRGKKTRGITQWMCFLVIKKRERGNEIILINDYKIITTMFYFNANVSKLVYESKTKKRNEVIFINHLRTYCKAH